MKPKNKKIPEVNTEFIVVKNSGIHNKGVFASKFIPKGTKIIEYVGEKITKTEAYDRIDKIEKEIERTGKPQTFYIFELNKRYDIDGDFEWNPAKYINHSCEPNCEIEIIDNKIWIFALKDIKEGEELIYNYGFDFDEKDFFNHPCKCGSENCVGFIVDEDDWGKLKKHFNQKEIYDIKICQQRITVNKYKSTNPEKIIRR